MDGWFPAAQFRSPFDGGIDLAGRLWIGDAGRRALWQSVCRAPEQRDGRTRPRVIPVTAAMEAFLLRERIDQLITRNHRSPYLDCFLWNILAATKPATSTAAANMKKPLLAAGSLHR